MQTRIRGKAQHDGCPLGWSKCRSCFSSFVNQSTRLYHNAKETLQFTVMYVTAVWEELTYFNGERGIVCIIFWLMIPCCSPDVFVIMSCRCLKLLPKFWPFWTTQFFKGFLTQFYKSGSPVTTEHVAKFEIRWQKK